ncbi:LacI family DNA-binding transcriptional regulator [Opitutaceae bacterium TAV3]|nr:LacI family DNA-binding transcriptional regulator [Opitutaceae bacterium TAV3]
MKRATESQSQLKDVNMEAVARAAGVHRTTVSMALRGHPKLPEATRARIRELAERMGYRPNPLVQALMSTRAARGRGKGGGGGGGGGGDDGGRVCGGAGVCESSGQAGGVGTGARIVRLWADVSRCARAGGAAGLPVVILVARGAGNDGRAVCSDSGGAQYPRGVDRAAFRGGQPDRHAVGAVQCHGSWIQFDRAGFSPGGA